MQDEYTAPPLGLLLPEAARPYLTAEFGHFCFRCGLEPDEERPRMDVDHIIPVARGGGNQFGNYQFLCGPCNSWKGTRIYDFRPGEERREIAAGLPIIPNEERVRKTPPKVVPHSVPPVPPPTPFPMTPTMIRVINAAIETGHQETLEAAKELIDGGLRFEYNADIAHDAAGAARRLLDILVMSLCQGLDTAKAHHEAVALASRVTDSLEEASASYVDVSRQLTRSLDLVSFYADRDRRMRMMNLLLKIYAIIVTAGCLWAFLA